MYIIKGRRREKGRTEYLCEPIGERSKWLPADQLFYNVPNQPGQYFDDSDDFVSSTSNNNSPKVLEEKSKALRRGKYSKKPSITTIPEKKRFGEKVRDFGKRIKSKFNKSKGLQHAVKGRRTYSTKGKIRERLERLNNVVDEGLGTVETFGTISGALATGVEAAVGKGRREGRTPGRKAKIEQKAGQTLNLVSDTMDHVPIFGGILASPPRFIGLFLEQHAAGASKRQAVIKAVANTAIGAATGFIPVYKNYEAALSVAKDINGLISAPDRFGDSEYLWNLKERIDALDDMMQNILNNLDFLTEEEYEKLSKELKT